jgi:hypothetical protein
MMRIVTLAPQTGLAMPNDDELAKLMAIVLTAHSWLAGFDLAEFRRSFWAQGKCYRTAAPDKSRYFQSWVDDANALLERFDKRGVEGASFLAACLAAGDVVWQRADPSVGALLELGLNQYTGRPCSNAWRSVLRGQPLLEPVTPGVVRAPSNAIPRPRFYQEDSAGVMKEFNPAPRWAR